VAPGAGVADIEMVAPRHGLGGLEFCFAARAVGGVVGYEWPSKVQMTLGMLLWALHLAAHPALPSLLRQGTNTLHAYWIPNQ
jgi:hypothetical protein